MSDEPYHNKGFASAYIMLVFVVVIFPAILLFTAMGRWGIFVQRHLPDGDCWENAKHEKVCKGEVDCKFLRNFCVKK